MGLGGNNIGTWIEMKKQILGKYQDYYKDKECKKEIFRMSQKEDESLEDYIEIFKSNTQHSRQSHLDE
jgi:hypothetical protein